MTSPRGAYGGGYYASPAFPDTPIYDRIVAERGTPQIAPIRVPAAYQPSNLPALPALPSAAPAHTPPHGTHNNGYIGSQQQSYGTQVAPLQNAPMPYIPQQSAARAQYAGGGSGGYTNGAGYQAQAPYQGGQSSYETGPRPVPPRPAPPRQVPAATQYGDDQFRRPYPGQGY